MKMCLCCQKNNPNIIIDGSVVFSICGQSNCKDSKGQNVGEWLLNERMYFIDGNEYFIMSIDNKDYSIPVDKRVIKGLKNKIMEIIIKKHGISDESVN